MSRKWFVSLIGAILSGLYFTSAALAGGGGYSVVYDRAPVRIVVAQPTVINFQITSECSGAAITGLNPNLTATSLITGRQLTVAAKAAQVDGAYQATIAFPTEGQWRWRVNGEEYMVQSDQFAVVVGAPAPVVKTTSLLSLLQTLMGLRVIVSLPASFFAN